MRVGGSMEEQNPLSWEKLAIGMLVEKLGRKPTPKEVAILVDELAAEWQWPVADCWSKTIN